MYSSYKRTEQNVRFTSSSATQMVANMEFISEYERLYRDALAPNSIKHLESCQKLFADWCDDNGLSKTLPISPLQVSRYVEYLGGKVSLQTIKNRVWAIGELHRSRLLPSPGKDRLVVLTIRATQRRYGSHIGQAPALCKAEVIDICNRLGDAPIDLRDKALLLMASDSWCRASELVELRVQDVDEQSDGSGMINIMNSKYDPYGRGEHAYLSKSGMTAVKRLVAATNKKKTDYLFTSFRYADPGGKIVPTTVSRVFKKRTGRKDISAHSTRIGGVHDALRLGCELVQIMNAGRWASPEMPAVYGRKLLASKSAAADVCRAYEDLHRE